MITKDVFEQVVKQQRDGISRSSKEDVVREILPDILKQKNIPHALTITGLRRAGKSTLQRQIMRGIKDDDWHYVNFDTEQFVNFKLDDFARLEEFLTEKYGSRRIWFFDEIQHIPGWERAVRRMYDEGNKFYITGSNASMVSRELGTRLTGRTIPYTLYPFSFREYLSARGHKWHEDDLILSRYRAALKACFSDYLQQGGLPEAVLFKKSEIAQHVYRDILYRDIIVRHNIDDEGAVRRLGVYLMSNIAVPVNYSSLTEPAGIQSPHTVRSYLDFFEDSYLLFSLKRFDFSLKKQMRAPKKVYAIDPAIAKGTGFQFSANRGRMLENCVFLELKRQLGLGEEIYYYRAADDLEVDFLLWGHSRAAALVQVSWSLAEPKTKKREVNSLLSAMRELKLREGLILTNDEEGEIKDGSKRIIIKPVWKWLL